MRYLARTKQLAARSSSSNLTGVVFRCEIPVSRVDFIPDRRCHDKSTPRDTFTVKWKFTGRATSGGRRKPYTGWSKKVARNLYIIMMSIVPQIFKKKKTASL